MAEPSIMPSYTDAFGVERSSPQWAVDQVREILAEDRASTGAGYRQVLRCRAGEPATEALAGCTLLLEDGGEAGVTDVVPPDLPFGYHRIDDDDGPSLVLHAPARCPSAGARPGWVLAAQLYAVRSADSWGHGDLRDARRLVAWIDHGGPGGHLMVNPLHAPHPGAHPQASPYSPSSRVFRSPLYLCVDEVADALDRSDAQGDEADEVARRAAEARALNADRRIDRDRVWAAKRTALEALWRSRRADPSTVARVDRHLADPVNRAYATYCVTVEGRGGEPPTATSVELRSPDDPTDAERFQGWLQLLLEDQLHAVGGALIHDLAVGADGTGADAWLWPGCYVLDGTRVGVPPDQFNTLGQDWGFPPFHPGGLRAAGYEPFVRAVRSALTGAAGVRIDHVMGLERLLWIPPEGTAADGVYVRYDLHEMLDVVAIESERVDAFVVGEDLGTVPPTIREAMADRGLLSYRVVALDTNHPSSYPTEALAAITTHDLPTTIGLLSGSDLEDQIRLDLSPNEHDTHQAALRLRAWAADELGATDEARRSDQAGDDDEASGADQPTDAAVLVAPHHLLAQSPVHLVAATLEHLGLVAERPNMPGTIDTWPNWSWGLPQPIEELLATDVAGQVRAALAARAQVTS